MNEAKKKNKGKEAPKAAAEGENNSKTNFLKRMRKTKREGPMENKVLKILKDTEAI